ncbi:hypothetical protein BC835DRAFT_1297864 [Cytidiella melzeri]|nr:hypothetical protein BC835DRAFT_1297864 [Cytidiella melzeri]
MALRFFTSVSALLLLISTALVAASDCQPGTYGSNGQSPCTSCPPGYYQSQSRSSSCTEAQSGWYAAGPGAIAQLQCGVGYYSSPGSSQCTACPPGSNCNSQTNSAPTLCTPGRYMPTSGAGDCINCPPGTFSAGYGATACCSCCSGWYTDQSGQTHCFNCPNRGSFQQGWSPVGASSANQCIAASGALSSCTANGNTCPPTGGSNPSGIPNTKRDNLQSPLKPSHRCSRGQKSCPIYGSVFKRSYLKTYECVDVQNELEKCGGCVHSDSPHGEVTLDGGRDCSAIPNVDSVRCQGGQCLIDSCMTGYVVSTDGTRCRPHFNLKSSSRLGTIFH